MLRVIITVIVGLITLSHQAAFANPYWNPERVPKDSAYPGYGQALPSVEHVPEAVTAEAVDVLRIQVDWQDSDEQYQIGKSVIEASGTPALLARSRHKPNWGSYQGVLRDETTKAVVYYDAVGTGREYRKLVRALSFRFPVPTHAMMFELYAENPSTGVMEKVLTKRVAPATLQKEQKLMNTVEIKELALASASPALRVNIYAEGYADAEKKSFWQQAMKTVQVLRNEKFPGVDHMSFYGVFQVSNKKLGSPHDLGKPIPAYDSFLGLYYPYWENFGRWYDVVYPTREDKMRSGFALAPYDYPLVLVNSDSYWGVGNYMAFTAIPAANPYYFTYLLLHEFGHFFGLNEEYEGGGRTELEFAPNITEPWSQNMTFLADTRHDQLKWKAFVDPATPLPTPDSVWSSSPPVYGAYLGGYADSTSMTGKSHKPGLNCVMEDKKHFCQVCTQAIRQIVDYDLGL